MTDVAPQTQRKTAAEVRNVAVDFRGKLDSGELLSGTPTITESTGDLTLSNKRVNTAALTLLDETVAIGQAVQFKVSGGTAGTTYNIDISVSTDSSPAQTLTGRVRVQVT